MLGARALGHFTGHRLTHRAMSSEGFRLHPNRFLLGLVAVRAMAGKENSGSPGNIGESVRQKTARARFSHCQCQAALRQFAHHHFLQLVIAPAVDKITHMLLHDGLRALN